ncbi:MAG: hypothetical protein EOM50_01850 [Erysipelotrichia bacterium]|nr:hypothetical protein [Erysipelotrichia bacterium]NCC55914.1 hypothetical protein [Erysipelotrichia bacterium]
MMMEVFLSEEKAIANNYDINQCHEVIDNFFAKRGIKKVAEGVYSAPDSQNAFTAFGVATGKFPRSSWFLKIVDEWYLRFESDAIEDREDCIEVYYKVKSRNERKR